MAPCCELLQKVYLCSNTNNSITHIQMPKMVVNCFKKCIFAVIQTTVNWQILDHAGCELLQKVYLCSNTNNQKMMQQSQQKVVNCFKKCIFAVIQTTHQCVDKEVRCCELLQKVYLCSNTNNTACNRKIPTFVVNCFKKCIFAVIQTTKGNHKV